MLKSMIKLAKLSSLTKTLCAESILDSVKNAPVPYLNITCKHSKKSSDRRDFAANVKSDDGTEGEHSINIDNVVPQHSIFPDRNTPSLLFGDTVFAHLPICNIRTSRNNTVLSLTEHTGILKMIHSCGVEGYKNSKKGTNIAAQATAITFGTKVLQKGVHTVRIVVQGLGPGRMSAIKGVQMSGLNVVSITDATRVSCNPPRPRKARRL